MTAPISAARAEQRERMFPGLVDQVAEARAFVAAALTGLGCRDDAVLATSEMAANAVAHSSSGTTGGTFAVHICRSPSSVVVHVHDQGGPGDGALEPPITEPCPAMPGCDAEEGRGLPIVGEVTTAYGSAPAAACTGRPGTPGRCSWFWCALSPASTELTSC